jgi:hypothetical protein
VRSTEVVICSVAPGPAPAAADPAEGPKWVMVGLVPLFDPPRHDTKETIERCHEVRGGGAGGL